MELPGQFSWAVLLAGTKSEASGGAETELLVGTVSEVLPGTDLELLAGTVSELMAGTESEPVVSSRISSTMSNILPPPPPTRVPDTSTTELAAPCGVKSPGSRSSLSGDFITSRGNGLDGGGADSQSDNSSQSSSTEVWTGADAVNNFFFFFSVGGPCLPCMCLANTVREVATNLNKNRDEINQCCGSGLFIPDPDFLPIPDPGSRIPAPKTATKERGENNLLYRFCSPKFHKIENYFIFEMLKKKFGPIFKKLWNFSPTKLSLSSQKYGFGIRDLEKKTYSGSRI
jgi:hypothetical protein